jgi:hypothetical protein
MKLPILASLLHLVDGIFTDWLAGRVDIFIGALWAAKVDVEMWSEGPFAKNFDFCFLETTKNTCH